MNEEPVDSLAGKETSPELSCCLSGIKSAAKSNPIQSN